jgi:CRP-like cAMP-binding protein
MIILLFEGVSLNIREFFQSWLNSHSICWSADFEPWLATMRECSFERDQMLVQAGEQPRRLYFLERGLVRLFYTTHEGKERNKAFFGAGDVTGPVSAAMTDSPAPFSIQALEPGSAISADFTVLLQHSNTHSESNKLFIELLSQAFIRNEQREAMLLTCNAEQRYQWLQNNEPHLLERVPQFHIASYIGVDPVSLSRLKRKLNDESHSGPSGQPAH